MNKNHNHKKNTKKLNNHHPDKKRLNNIKKGKLVSYYTKHNYDL